MKRPIESWQKCDPALMAAAQSAVAREFAFADAKADICALHKALAIFLGEDEDADYMTTADKRDFARRVMTVDA